MKVVFLTFAVLSLVFRLGNAALGDACADDAECTAVVTNSACTELVCACATNYAATSDGQCVAAGSLGAACTTDAECTEPDLACNSNYCGCDSDHVLSGDACVDPPPAALGDACANDAECTAVVTNSACTELVCACATNYAATSDGQCVAAGSLGAACTTDAECTGADLACNNNYCGCDSSHVLSGDVCADAVALGGDCSGAGTACASATMECSAETSKCVCAAGYKAHDDECATECTADNEATKCTDDHTHCDTDAGVCTCEAGYTKGDDGCTDSSSDASIKTQSLLGTTLLLLVCYLF